MKYKNDKIKNQILETAMGEFLEKGFAISSLRCIATRMNGTTGVIYTYFKNKNQIFETLVSPVILEFENRLAREDLPKNMAALETGMSPKTWFTKNLKFLIRLVEKYPNEMKLLFLKSQGSSFQNFKTLLIEKGMARSLTAFRALKRSKEFKGQVLSEFFVLNLVKFVVNIVVEILKQDSLPEEVAAFENEISSFLFNGWKALVKL